MESMLLPLLGGLMIGVATVLLYGAAGRIAGISGITFGLLWGDATDRGWRGGFVAGLVAGAWLAVAFGMPLPQAPLPDSTGGVMLLVAAGVLVGFGTRLGNGCTSGHGICGLARLSPRSLVAVAIFMGVGMIAATLLRPLLQ